MKKILNIKALLSLLIVGTISGIIWHIEIIYHGWAGLIWTTYFHFAFPISLFMFLVWLFIIKQDTKKLKRILFIVIAMIVSIIIYYLTKLFMSFTFSAGPSAMLMLPSEGNGYYILIYLLYFLPIVIVAFTYFSTKIFFKETIFLYYLISCGLIYLAIPISMLFLSLLGNNIYGFAIQTDFLHTIKTGIIIPFIIFAIGFPYILTEATTTTHNTA